VPTYNQTNIFEVPQVFLDMKAQSFTLQIDDNFSLRILTSEDVSDAYVRWMNDYEIVQYTEQRFYKHTAEDVKKFVSEKLASNTDFLFGMYYDDTHVGNIKLGPIDIFHGAADVSFIIGDKRFWGKGLAVKAIQRVIQFAFIDLKLKRLAAGYYIVNTGSKKVLEKCGFKFEGEQRGRFLFENVRMSHVFVGLVNED